MGGLFFVAFIVSALLVETRQQKNPKRVAYLNTEPEIHNKLKFCFKQNKLYPIFMNKIIIFFGIRKCVFWFFWKEHGNLKLDHSAKLEIKYQHQKVNGFVLSNIQISRNITTNPESRHLAIYTVYQINMCAIYIAYRVIQRHTCVCACFGPSVKPRDID